MVSPNAPVSGADERPHRVPGHARRAAPGASACAACGRARSPAAGPSAPNRAAGSSRSGPGTQRRERHRQDRLAVAHQRTHQPLVRARVRAAEPYGGLGHRSADRTGPAAVQRVRGRDLGREQPDAARGQVAARRRTATRPPGRARSSRRRARNPGSVSSAVRQPPPASADALEDLHRSPARASVSAAASPFGPGAHDDRVRSGHSETTSPSAARRDRHPAVPQPGGQLLQLGVGAVRLVMQQDHPPRARGRRGQSDRVLGGRVPERPRRVEVLGVPERVVHQDVGAAGQVQGRLVVHAEPGRARTEIGRAVVGQVRDRVLRRR